MQRQGVVPAVMTYSSLISTCEKGKQLARAVDFLEAMQRQGVVPSVIMCNSQVSTCEKCKRPARAVVVGVTAAAGRGA